MRSCCSLGKHHAQAVLAGSEGAFGACQFAQHRHTHTPGLLRCFQQDLLPALCSLRRGCEQGLLTSLRRERHNCAHSQLGGFFDRPFECVKLHDGQQQRHVHAGLNGSQLLDQCELDAIAADTFDPAEPHSFAVTQLIELARLGAQHTSQVMCRVTLHDGSLDCKMFNEESSSHAEILSQEECY